VPHLSDIQRGLKSTPKTSIYMALNILTFKKMSQKNDVYSFGVVDPT
jgi:serine/threonine protein kinase